MSTTLSIAEVSRRSGFSSPTLRYYEQAGLLRPPGRTDAGHRAYDESVLARLAFIARAKTLGCSLDEIAELMPHWDGGECRPVQDRLRDLATAKLDDVRARVVELQAFAADLQRLGAELRSHTPDGPCDAKCGCVADGGPRTARTPSMPASPARRSPVQSASEIACTLDPSEIPDRVSDWQSLLGQVVERTAVDDGLRLRFGDGTLVADVARLVAAEQSCCGFFRFAITVDDRGIGLEVRAPADAQPAVHSLFGAT